MATTWPPQAAWAVSTESHFRDSGTRRPGRELGAFSMSGYWSGLRIWLCEGARPTRAALGLKIRRGALRPRFQPFWHYPWHYGISEMVVQGGEGGLYGQPLSSLQAYTTVL